MVKKKSEVSNKRSIAALLEAHFGEKVRDIYVALKSAWLFFFVMFPKLSCFYESFGKIKLILFIPIVICAVEDRKL